MSSGHGRPISFDTIIGRSVGEEWGDPSLPPLLCLHGWLDNAASFAPLSTYLSKNHRMIALDLPGHGLSDPLPEPMTYQLVDSVAWLREVCLQISDQPINILGHSLGGVVATMYAGSFSGGLRNLLLVDSLGPLVGKDKDAPMRLKSFVDTALSKRLRNRAPRQYSKIDEAHKHRIDFSVTPIQSEAARIIVERGLARDDASGTYLWRHDEKLKWPSPVRFSEGQVLAFLAAIEVDVLLVRANPGIGLTEQIWDERVKACRRVEVHNIPGTHHVHMDQPEVVAPLINSFLDARPIS